MSEKLCLRFPYVVGWDGFEVVTAGCWGGAVVSSGVVEWAEMTGEVEAGVFGMAGSAEAIRGEGIGVVSSARTNVGRVNRSEGGCSGFARSMPLVGLVVQVT